MKSHLIPVTGRLFSSFSPSISLDFNIDSKDAFEPHFLQMVLGEQALI